MTKLMNLTSIIFYMLIFFIVQIVITLIYAMANDHFRMSFLLPLIAPISILIAGLLVNKSTENLWCSVNTRPLNIKSIVYAFVIITGTFFFIGYLTKPYHLMSIYNLPDIKSINLSSAQIFSDGLGGIVGDIFEVLSLCLIFPLVEELFFRGLIQNHLQKAFPILVAVLITSVLFAFVHTFADVNNFFSKFLSGLIFSLLYIKFGHIGYAVFAHAFSNTLTFLITIYVRTQADNMLFKIYQKTLYIHPVIIIVSAIICFLFLVTHLRRVAFFSR